ncbi:hypothetical protein [Nocardioides antri]|uniref:Uncharacterized protein n=1 Tax=Nocardioides antri TaxID=2607659 RepID=A0A5B1M1T4_9ACTN|nr:hypothetical protein [Nocardioides antri]KAA1426606.1 hypothetical protein F0U47_14570 [Nocardioides antri]
MKRFEVDVRRDGKWWMINIPEIGGITQARRLAEAGQAAAEYIALSEDLALSEVEVDIVSVDVNGTDVRAAGELVEQLRIEVRALEGLIAQLTSATARRLVDDEVPLRDIAEVLGVSHQRVAQITGGTEPRTILFFDSDLILLNNFARVATDVVAPLADTIARIQEQTQSAREAAEATSRAMAPARSVFEEINRSLAPVRERMRVLESIGKDVGQIDRVVKEAAAASAAGRRAQRGAGRAASVSQSQRDAVEKARKLTAKGRPPGSGH